MNTSFSHAVLLLLEEDIWSKANAAIQSITTGVLSIVDGIFILAIIVCAIFWALSDAQTARMYKNWFFRILAAGVLINTAAIIWHFVSSLA